MGHAQVQVVPPFSFYNHEIEFRVFMLMHIVMGGLAVARFLIGSCVDIGAVVWECRSVEDS
jgi:hypothetical protein